MPLNYSNTRQPDSKYVVVHITHTHPARLLSVKRYFCHSVADVRVVLSFKWKAWSMFPLARLCLVNGHTPEQLPADAIITQTARMGYYPVARLMLKRSRHLLEVCSLAEQDKRRERGLPSAVQFALED